MMLSVLYGSGEVIENAVSSLSTQARIGVCSTVQRVLQDRSAGGYSTRGNSHSLLMVSHRHRSTSLTEDSIGSPTDKKVRGNKDESSGEQNISTDSPLLSKLTPIAGMERQDFVQTSARERQALLLTSNGNLYQWHLKAPLAAAENAPLISETPPEAPRSPFTRSKTRFPPLTQSSTASDAGLCLVQSLVWEKALRGVSVVQLACGSHHSAIRTAPPHCDVWTWGLGREGRLGHGGERSEPAPRCVEALIPLRVFSIAAGSAHTAAITMGPTELNRLESIDRDALARTHKGEREPGFFEERDDHPLLAEQIKRRNAEQRAGAAAALGAVWTWGRGSGGRLGHGDETSSATSFISIPRRVSGMVRLVHRALRPSKSKGSGVPVGSQKGGGLNHRPSPLPPTANFPAPVSSGFFSWLGVDSGSLGKTAAFSGANLSSSNASASKSGTACSMISTSQPHFPRELYDLVRVGALDCILKLPVPPYPTSSTSRSLSGSASGPPTCYTLEGLWMHAVRPERAIALGISCGNDFTVVYTADGDVWTWGVSKEGQCGRTASELVKSYNRLLSYPGVLGGAFPKMPPNSSLNQEGDLLRPHRVIFDFPDYACRELEETTRSAQVTLSRMPPLARMLACPWGLDASYSESTSVSHSNTAALFDSSETVEAFGGMDAGGAPMRARSDTVSSALSGNSLLGAGDDDGGSVSAEFDGSNGARGTGGGQSTTSTGIVQSGRKKKRGCSRAIHPWVWASGIDPLGVGRLGDVDGSGNSIVGCAVPLALPIDSVRVCGVSAGGGHTLAVTRDGHVWTWGSNSMGQAGKRSLIPVATPSTVPVHIFMTAAMDEAFGKGMGVGPSNDSLYERVGKSGVASNDSSDGCTDGRSASSKENDGGHSSLTASQQSSSFSLPPCPLSAPSVLAGFGKLVSAGDSGCVWDPVVEVVAGERHSFVLTEAGVILSWGENTHGECGQGWKPKGPSDSVGLPGVVSVASWDERLHVGDDSTSNPALNSFSHNGSLLRTPYSTGSNAVSLGKASSPGMPKEVDADVSPAPPISVPPSAVKCRDSPTQVSNPHPKILSIAAGRGFSLILTEDMEAMVALRKSSLAHGFGNPETEFLDPTEGDLIDCEEKGGIRTHLGKNENLPLRSTYSTISSLSLYRSDSGYSVGGMRSNNGAGRVLKKNVDGETGRSAVALSSVFPSISTATAKEIQKEEARRAETRRLGEANLQSLIDTWETKLRGWTGSWDSYKVREESLMRLWRLGIPAQLRCRVWPLAVGNALRLTPAMFELFCERAQRVKLILRHGWGIGEGVGGKKRIHENGDSLKSHSFGLRSSTLISQGSGSLDGRLTPNLPQESPSLFSAPAMDTSTSGDQLIGLEDTLEQIPMDLLRTLPSLRLFGPPGTHSAGPLHSLVRDVLEAYACFRPDMGYVQGMSYIAAMISLFCAETTVMANVHEGRGGSGYGSSSRSGGAVGSGRWDQNLLKSTLASAGSTGGGASSAPSSLMSAYFPAPAGNPAVGVKFSSIFNPSSMTNSANPNLHTNGSGVSSTPAPSIELTGHWSTGGTLSPSAALSPYSVNVNTAALCAANKAIWEIECFDSDEKEGRQPTPSASPEAFSDSNSVSTSGTPRKGGESSFQGEGVLMGAVFPNMSPVGSTSSGTTGISGAVASPLGGDRSSVVTSSSVSPTSASLSPLPDPVSSNMNKVYNVTSNTQQGVHSAIFPEASPLNKSSPSRPSLPPTPRNSQPPFTQASPTPSPHHLPLLVSNNRFLTFQVLANLMSRHHFHVFFAMDSGPLAPYYDLFDSLLLSHCPNMASHLVRCGIQCEMYLVGWLQTVFLKCLPLETAAWVWDCFLLEGVPALYRTAIAIVTLLEGEILKVVQSSGPNGLGSCDAMEITMQVMTQARGSGRVEVTAVWDKVGRLDVLKRAVESCTLSDDAVALLEYISSDPIFYRHVVL